MENGDEKKKSNYYSVLGLEKECSSDDLKIAYKKLAMRWHPDRCLNSKFVEDSNKKFQDIQHAYSVLSNENNRFLYDVGVYDNDDDQNNQGMGDFLNEMVVMMNENKPSENGEESFEQLQELFEEMFHTDAHNETFTSTSQGSSSCSSSYVGSFDTTSYFNGSNKRNSSQMNNQKGSSSFSSHFQDFCLGADQFKGDAHVAMGSKPRRETQQRAGSNRSSNNNNNNNNNNNSHRRQGRKQKISSAHDVSSNDYNGIFT